MCIEGIAMITNDIYLSGFLAFFDVSITLDKKLLPTETAVRNVTP